MWSPQEERAKGKGQGHPLLYPRHGMKVTSWVPNVLPWEAWRTLSNGAQARLCVLVCGDTAISKPGEQTGTKSRHKPVGMCSILTSWGTDIGSLDF